MLEKVIGKTVHNKKLFIILFCSLILFYSVSIVIHYHGSVFYASIFSSIGSGVLTAFIVAFVVYYFSPEENRSRLIVLGPGELNEALRNNSHEVESYAFKGALGRWVRDPVVQIIENGKRKHLRLNLTLVFINPIDNHVCQRYLEQKKSLDQSKDVWSIETIQNQIIATVSKIVFAVGNYHNLDLKISFLNSFSSFRYDFSERGGVLTQAGLKKKGIYVPKGSDLYEVFKQEIYDSLKQADEYKFDYKTDFKLQVKEVASKFEIKVSDDRLSKIEQIMNSYRSEYEK